MASLAESFERSLAKIITKKAGYLSFRETPIEIVYGDTRKSEIDEIDSLLDTYMALIHAPHRKSETEEILIRAELASEVTPEQFRATTMEPYLWKKKQSGRISPEYVHSIEYEDSLITYENEVVYEIFKLLRRRLDILENQVIEEGNSLERLYQSRLGIFPENGPISHYLQDPEKVAKYLAKIRDDDLGERLARAQAKARRLSISEFNRVIEKSRKVPPHPYISTNILIHDPKYNRIYRYYLSNFAKKDKLYDNSPFVYLAYRMLDELISSGYDLAQEPNFKYKDGKFTITAFSFNKEGFLYHVKFNPDSIRIEIMYRGAVHTRQVLIRDVFLPKIDERALLDDSYVVCLKNLSDNFDGVLEVNPENPLPVFPRLFETLSLVIPMDGRSLVHCPICGSPSLMDTGRRERTCPDCHSTLALLGGAVDPAVWVDVLRGR